MSYGIRVTGRGRRVGVTGMRSWGQSVIWYGVKGMGRGSWGGDNGQGSCDGGHGQVSWVWSHMVGSMGQGVMTHGVGVTGFGVMVQRVIIQSGVIGFGYWLEGRGSPRGSHELGVTGQVITTQEVCGHSGNGGMVLGVRGNTHIVQKGQATHLHIVILEQSYCP